MQSNPAGIYLLKVNNKNIRTIWEICSKLTIKTPERHRCRRSGIFIFEHVSHLVLVFLLSTYNLWLLAGNVVPKNSYSQIFQKNSQENGRGKKNCWFEAKSEYFMGEYLWIFRTAARHGQLLLIKREAKFYRNLFHLLDWSSHEIQRNFLRTEAVARRCSIKKKSALKNSKFTGKHLCYSLLFHKKWSLLFNKKWLWHRRIFLRILLNFKNTFL